MEFLKRSRRKGTGVNASSMADIAFLLLIFFLVTTTIMIDQGITVKLPPYAENDNLTFQKVKDRNVLRVLVNSSNELLVEGERGWIRNLKNQAIQFITNPNQSPKLSESPKRAVISLQNDRGTTYETYIAVYNELKAAYNEIWDKEAQKRFGFKYDDLENKDKKAIQADYPLVISEAEPTDFGS